MAELTPERLAALRQIAEAATPGPLTMHLCDDARYAAFVDAPHLGPDAPELAVFLIERDARFFAEFDRDTVLAMLYEIERLRTLEARFLCDEGKVCGACGGIGFRSYGSTSAWRGGAGGQTMTEGICDRCWGTGNEGKPGPNLRRIEARIARLERDRETLAAAVMAQRERNEHIAECEQCDYELCPVGGELSYRAKRILDAAISLLDGEKGGGGA